LLRRRAHTATVAAEGGTAALGLALVVLEHEQLIGTRLEGRAPERLIRGRVTPGRRIARGEANIVEGTHRLIRILRAAAVRQRIRGEALNLVLEAIHRHGLHLISTGIH